MQLRVEGHRALQHEDGTPLVGVSALAPLGGGWLVASSDGDAVWEVGGRAHRVGLVQGRQRATGIEAACTLGLKGAGGALLLGSGATPESRYGAVVLGGDPPEVEVGDLADLYVAVAHELDVPLERLDLQGVSRNGEVLRWFHRGDPSAGDPSASVDVDLARLVAALRGGDASSVRLRSPRRYDLGPLAATDAVALPSGRVLLSAVAPDGSASALVLLDGSTVVETVPLPALDGAVARVTALGLQEVLPGELRLRALAGGPDVPARELSLILSR